MEQGSITADARSLPRILIDKPWGQSNPPAPFHALHDGTLGELWFNPPPELDRTLVKYLFTGEKLSVQVHPSGANAPVGQSGKEECWYILDAKPGAQVALGLTQEMTAKQLRKTSMDGSIADYLAWHDVKAGDFMTIAPGTIHAIGGGLTILEVQQNCDITYRLFDYGRPRDLHLDDAVRCANPRPYDALNIRAVAPSGNVMLMDGDHYAVARLDSAPSDTLSQKLGGPFQIVVLGGDVAIDDVPVAPGLSTIAPSLDGITFGAQAQIMVIVQR